MGAIAMTERLARSLVGRILSDMRLDTWYSVQAIATWHTADPSLVQAILEKGVEQKRLERDFATPPKYRKLRQPKPRRKRTQLDWIVDN